MKTGDPPITSDAWPVQSGERWAAAFSSPLSALSVAFSEG
jgi:hypothetical protein